MYRLILLSFCLSGALGQLIKLGVCDYTAIGGYVTDLNFTRMLGTWNEIARIDNGIEKGECASMTIDGQYDAQGALTGSLAYHLEVINKTKTYHNGTLGPDTPLVGGILSANMPGFLSGTLVIQSTNYTDYAVVYSCTTLTQANATQNATKLITAWQLHRKTSLSSSEQASITQIINTNPDLNGTAWKSISHTAAACGNTGVNLAVPHALIILATLFIGKGFINTM